MVRLIVAIAGGVIAAFAIVFVSDALFHALSPTAAAMPTDMNDREAMRVYVASQPIAILVGLEAAWGAAAFAGAWIAARFGARGAWPGWIVTGLFLVATTSNFLMVPHPAWMVVLGLGLTGGAGWAGARIGTRARARP